MSEFRLYKSIYKINHYPNSETYTLVTPYSITSEVYRVTDSALIEAITPTNESTGLYYSSLNSLLYSYTEIYELRWYVQYTSDSSTLKTLKMRFKFQPVSTTSGYFKDIDIELQNNDYLEYIINDNNIEIELINSQ